MSKRDLIISLLPLDRHFGAHEIAQKAYPELDKIDSNGRAYNFGVAATARILRSIDGVVEVKHKIFYAHAEYF